MTTSRVLYAEDELLLRELVVEALRDEGFEVIEAHDGRQAVHLIDSLDRFDLLLTDVQLPGPIDGIQVALHARQRHPGIPVVVVSAQSDNAVRVARLSPRKTFVVKPYELETLLKTIQRILDPHSPASAEFA